MKKLLCFLALTALTLFNQSFGCSILKPSYEFHDDKGNEYVVEGYGYTVVEKAGMIMSSGISGGGLLEISKVDLKTFKQSKFSVYYAQDQYHVFYQGKIIEGLEPDSLVYLGGIVDRAVFSWQKDGYVKDRHAVFLKEKKYIRQTQRVLS